MKTINVPPAADVNLTFGEQFEFVSMQQNWTICFGNNPLFGVLSNASFSNQTVRGSAPSQVTSISYNVVTSGTCNPNPIEGTPKTIHVSSSKEASNKNDSSKKDKKR